MGTASMDVLASELGIYLYNSMGLALPVHLYGRFSSLSAVFQHRARLDVISCHIRSSTPGQCTRLRPQSQYLHARGIKCGLGGRYSSPTSRTLVYFHEFLRISSLSITFLKLSRIPQ